MTQVSSTLHLHDHFYASPDQVSLSKKKPSKYEEELEKDITCGVGACRPKWLQRLVHPIPFLIVYSVLGMVQGLLWSYYVGIFTTLEKRYSYKSKITGIISLSDNFGIIVSSLVIGYFGGQGHRPRWIAVGMILAAMGALISASPYWIFGAVKHQSISIGSVHRSTELCTEHANSTDSHCHDVSRTKLNETLPAVCLVVLGNIVNGIGLTAFYIVGAPYLDDNIKKTLTPIYFGVMYAVRLLGPALGFFLASATLQIYEDPSITPDFEPTDPRWVGAWWLGFVIIAAILIFLSLILYLFPRKIKWSEEDIEPKPKTIAEVAHQNTSIKKKVKELSRIISKLFTNRTLMFRYAGECCNLLGTLGFVLFMPKYLENQFRQGASDANKMAGIAGTLFMVVGFVISSIVISKWKPSPRVVAAWISITGVINALALVGAGTITCDNNNVVNYSECSTDCHCSAASFRPVCFNETTFFSSCLTGCKTAYTVNDTKIYDDCGCTASKTSYAITPGYCPSSCNLILYLTIIVVSNLISSSSKVGGILITLRSVEPRQKSVALAISSMMLCIFAFIPCPLLYGAVIDSTCDIWEEKCGETGNCWVYDLDKFRIVLHGLSASFIILGAVFDSFMCYFSKSIDNLYAEINSSPDEDSKP